MEIIDSASPSSGKTTQAALFSISNRDNLHASSSFSNKVTGKNSERICLSGFLRIVADKFKRSAARLNKAGVILPLRKGKPAMTASLVAAIC